MYNATSCLTEHGSYISYDISTANVIDTCIHIHRCNLLFTIN